MKAIKGIVIWFGIILIQSATGFAANFNDLSIDDQERVRAGELVSIPVRMDQEEKLFKGTFFRYVRNIEPEIFAAVFYDYEHQDAFVPGMNFTKILREKGRKARVTHHINPIIFISPNAEEVMPAALYEAGTYTYELDEQLHSDGRNYAITWQIPKDHRFLGSNEVGSIAFQPFGQGAEQGTLITYENGTMPFLYKYIFKRKHPHLEAFLSGPAQRYYKATVNNLLRRTNEVIQNGDIKDILMRFESGLASENYR